MTLEPPVPNVFVFVLLQLTLGHLIVPFLLLSRSSRLTCHKLGSYRAKGFELMPMDAHGYYHVAISDAEDHGTKYGTVFCKYLENGWGFEGSEKCVEKRGTVRVFLL